MKNKRIIGFSAIAVVCLIPVLAWFMFGPDASEFTQYSDITHNLGELFGLVGMTMFALTFVLSTRINFIESIFDGLDKVYIVHGVLGGLAIIFILAHPIFLVLKFIPSEVKTAAIYLLPSSYWSVNFGIMALLGMIALIFITLYTKMKYHRWKFTHEFLGLMFIFAAFHIFMVQSDVADDGIFAGYPVYAITVTSIGLLAFTYSLFIKNRLVKNAVYTVSSITNNKDVFEVVMSPEHKPISYKSGQFIFVRFFNEYLSKEAHPFSIASKSDDENIRIIIKKLGDFTSKLSYLNIGDKVSVEGPYGRFNYRKAAGSDQVWIAGGIGITPFLGMAQDLYREDLRNDVYLYYSARDDSDFIGYNLLKDLAVKTSKFKFFSWNSSKQGYLTADKILELCKGYRGKEFFICGPQSFKSGIIDNLIKLGVRKDHIHEEAFDFR